MFTGAVIAALSMPSVILTASVLFPDLDSRVIVDVLVGGDLGDLADPRSASAGRSHRQPNQDP